MKAAEAIESGAGTVILNVTLDTSQDPPVVIDDRDKGAATGDKIKWMKSSGPSEFKFVDFQPQDAEFEDVDIQHNKIECDFETTNPAGTAHHYTILVEDDEGNQYSSDIPEILNPDEGRAVIRN